MNKILIIEDEADIVKVLTKRLLRHSFKVIVAGEGWKGTELAHKEKPNLIILDLMLPAGDGLTVLKNLKMISRTAYIPVVVLTGKSDEEYKKKVIAEGVEAYLQKPYDVNELISIINEILKDKGEVKL